MTCERPHDVAIIGLGAMGSVAAFELIWASLLGRALPQPAPRAQAKPAESGSADLPGGGGSGIRDRDAATWQASEIRSLEPAFSADTWLGIYPLADRAQRMRLRAAMVEVGAVGELGWRILTLPGGSRLPQNASRCRRHRHP